jgi:hypothetical protein
MCYTAYVLTLVTPSLREWKVFPTPGAVTNTRITLDFLINGATYKSCVSLWGSFCAYGVSGTPYGEVCNNVYTIITFETIIMITQFYQLLI